MEEDGHRDDDHQFRLALPRGDVMHVVGDRVSLTELKGMAEHGFGTMVKVVVDVGPGIMAVDAELQSDEEALLLENSSAQRDLWGINLYPDIAGEDWIEFDSLINLGPAAGNRSRGSTIRPCGSGSGGS